MQFNKINNFVIFMLKIMWFFGIRNFYTRDAENNKLKMYISEWLFLFEIGNANYKKAIKYVDDIFDNMCEIAIGVIAKLVFDKVDVFATIEFSKVLDVLEKYRDKSEYLLLTLANARFNLPVITSDESDVTKFIDGIDPGYMRKMRNELIPIVNKRNQYSADAAIILGIYYYLWELDKKNGFKYMCLSVQLGNSIAYGTILLYFDGSEELDKDEAKNLVSSVECNLRNEIAYGKNTSASITALITMYIGGSISGKESRNIDKLKKLVDEYNYLFTSNNIVQHAIELARIGTNEYQDEQSREIYLYLKNKFDIEEKDEKDKKEN